MNNNKDLQFESLNNAVINSGIKGLELHHAFNEDRRRTVPMFYVTYNGTSISPSKMDYNACNHFLLGLSTMKKKISTYYEIQDMKEAFFAGGETILEDLRSESRCPKYFSFEEWFNE